jgi:hypothetical protein
MAPSLFKFLPDLIIGNWAFDIGHFPLSVCGRSILAPAFCPLTSVSSGSADVLVRLLFAFFAIFCSKEIEHQDRKVRKEQNKVPP